MVARRSKPVIGWREWVELVGLCPSPLKAKIDTGARTSALHAFGLEIVGDGTSARASFEIHPHQRSADDPTRVTCPVTEFRTVRSSNGRDECRPVITVPVRLGEVTWSIEVTLTRRDEMGFRMLLGRAAVRKRFLVDPGRSFLCSRPQEGASP